MRKKATVIGLVALLSVSASGDDPVSFMLWNGTPVSTVTTQCNNQGANSTPITWKKTWSTYGKYICNGGSPQGTFENANFEVVGAGACGAWADCYPDFEDPTVGTENSPWHHWFRQRTFDKQREIIECFPGVQCFAYCFTAATTTHQRNTQSVRWETDAVCQDEPEQSWCEAENFNPCSVLEDWDGTQGQPNWETCECDWSESPILLDLEGRGQNLHLTSAAEGVLFDHNGDGEPELTAWTSGDSRVGFLVLDRNGDGAINDGAELFGDSTAQPDAPQPNGFKALAVYDAPSEGGNGDGQISAADEIFASLRFWVDLNHDGSSRPAELLTLAQTRVVSLSLDFKESRRTDQHGNQCRYRAPAAMLKKGKLHRTWAVDVFFKVIKTPNQATPAG